jgi:hypothetical protein
MCWSTDGRPVWGSAGRGDERSEKQIGEVASSEQSGYLDSLERLDAMGAWPAVGAK